MMNARIISVGFLFLVISTPAQDSKIAVPKEMEQLRKNYEAAVERALDPINATYEKELIKLRQKYLVEGAKEKVYTVDLELNRLDPTYKVRPLPGMEDKISLAEFLKNSQWSWFANDTMTGPKQWIHFGEGKIITASWKRRQYEFEIVGQNVVTFDGHVLTFDREKNQFLGSHVRPDNKRSGKLMSRRRIEAIPD